MDPGAQSGDREGTRHDVAMGTQQHRCCAACRDSVHAGDAKDGLIAGLECWPAKLKPMAKEIRILASPALLECDPERRLQPSGSRGFAGETCCCK